MKTLREALFNKKNLERNPYDITEKDMIGQLKGFPVGVVVRMIEEQEKQGNEPDVTLFQKLTSAGDDGFVWGESEAGHDFWYEVIREENFKLFFERYPEYMKY